MRIRAKLFWSSLILACAFFAFCAIDAVRLVGAYGLKAELDPFASWILSIAPTLFLVPFLLIVFIPWLCWRFINEDYGLVAAGIFLGITTIDAFTHIFLLL